MEITLAQALLRRKELQDKVVLLKHIKDTAFYEVRAQRLKAHEGLDDIIAHVPKLTASQITSEYDWHSRQLRLIDAHIQQANWTTKLEIEPEIMGDYATSKKD